MATASGNRQLQQLRAENKRLQLENDDLREKLASSKTASVGPGHSFLRKTGIVLSIGFAVALLFVGNLLFWTGNTIVKTDRYVEATAPLIKNPDIQEAIATKLSTQLYQNVDIEKVAVEALPPRADFLAPTLADQFKQHTNQAIRKIIERPQFQDRWNETNQRAHDRFINAVEAYGDNGSIDISEFYTQVSQQLKGTKLAFLADKPLPAKIGEIEVVKGNWLSVLQRTIQHIDAWRTIAVVLFIGFSALGIWLSRNRRKAVFALGSLVAAAMFISLLSVRLVGEVVANHADPQYADAVQAAYTTILHPLQVQTATILAASLLVILITWITSGSSSSRRLRRSVDQLLAGKLHAALFSKENAFTLWVGRHKRSLQWLVVAVVAVVTLLIHLTPAVLLWDALAILFFVLVIEVLAASF